MIHIFYLNEFIEIQKSFVLFEEDICQNIYLVHVWYGKNKLVSNYTEKCIVYTVQYTHNSILQIVQSVFTSSFKSE